MQGHGHFLVPVLFFFVPLSLLVPNSARDRGTPPPTARTHVSPPQTLLSFIFFLYALLRLTCPSVAAAFAQRASSCVVACRIPSHAFGRHLYSFSALAPQDTNLKYILRLLPGGRLTESSIRLIEKNSSVTRKSKDPQVRFFSCGALSFQQVHVHGSIFTAPRRRSGRRSAPVQRSPEKLLRVLHPDLAQRWPLPGLRPGALIFLSGPYIDYTEAAGGRLHTAAACCSVMPHTSGTHCMWYRPARP